ncbi:MAG: hypothetical protein ABIS92_17485 [Polyangia bacterium]
MVIKAIAIRHPQIARLAAGEVTIEVKAWRTDYRGDLLLVSALTPRIEPAGHALAVGRLVDCRPMTKGDETAAGKKRYQQAQAWVFEGVRPIKAFPVKPGLALFEVTLPAGGIKRVAMDPSRPPKQVCPPQAGDGEKIPTPRVLDVLVLEANAPVGRGMQRWVLERHKTRVVHSLDKAHSAIRDRTPDVVICDYEVGTETTAAFLQMLARSYPACRRVLYASSRAEVWQRFIDRTLVHGAVMKPASRKVLIDMIAK